MTGRMGSGGGGVCNAAKQKRLSLSEALFVQALPDYPVSFEPKLIYSIFHMPVAGLADVS